MIVSCAKGFRVGLQLFVSADELDGIDLGGRPATEQDKEIRVAGLPGFAQINSPKGFKLAFVAGDGGVYFPLTTRQRGKAGARLRDGTEGVHGEGIGL